MLLVEKTGPVAVVTLNRPEAMNSLSRGLRAALRQAFLELDADDEIRALVLTGAGERAFSAGLDLKELGSDPAAVQWAASSDPEVNPVIAALSCKKPVVGAINGVAITGGFELALACDVLICSSNARFADTHARVGILPTWGLSQRLSRVIGPYRAKELSLTGNFLDARTACDWGLVNRVVEPAELMPAAIRLAQDMAGVEGEMLVAYKKLIDDGYALSFGDGLVLEAKVSPARNAAVTPEMIEARRAAVQARGRSQ
jgi:enoyl-CoA hydratase